MDEDDMQELLNDTRLLKRLKKGKISEEDFDEQINVEQKTKHKTAGPPHASNSSGD